MDLGTVVTLIVGIAFLIIPALLGRNLARRWHRLASWPRAEACVQHVWKLNQPSSSENDTTVRARYEFRDVAGRLRFGDVDYLADPHVGDVLEVAYNPEEPKASETVYGGSVSGRIINYGVSLLLASLGIFLILGSTGLISL